MALTRNLLASLLLALAWAAVACAVTEPVATAVDAPPSPVPTLPPPSPTELVQAPQATPTPTATEAELNLSLPAPICLLDPQRAVVVRLSPDDLTSEIISPPDAAITAFDAGREPGSFVFATAAGELLAAADGEYRHFFQTSPPNEYEFRIHSLDLSPDGGRVAVSVVFDGWQTDSVSESVVDAHTGIFVVNIESGEIRKLISQEYPNPEQGDSVTDIAVFIEPLWSPDGEAIFLRVIHWEWFGIAWIYPIIEPEVTLHRPEVSFAWSEGSWSSDSRYLLLSGRINSDVSNLDRVDRTTGAAHTLLDGLEVETYVFDSHVAEKRILFTAFTSTMPDFQLFEGSLSDDVFTYELAGYPDPICSRFRLAWDARGEYGILACGGQIRAISSDGTLDTEFSALLPNSGLGRIEQFGWCP